MSQTTHWTGNAGDGLWETPGNWDNGVPVSAADTVVVMTIDNSGAGMSGPVSACTVGSLTLEQPSQFNNDFSNLTVVGSFSLSAQGQGATGPINLDASAVSGASMINAVFGGSIGDYFSCSQNMAFEGTGGNFGTFDGADDTFQRTSNSGTVGHGCQFINGAQNSPGTAGDATLFDNAINEGTTGDYTFFTNQSYNGYDPNVGSPTTGQTGQFTTYDDLSEDWATDEGDVVFNGNSKCQFANIVGNVTFNDGSSAYGGFFPNGSTGVQWNSTGQFQSDTAQLTTANITATTSITIGATNFDCDLPSFITKDLLDVQVSLFQTGGQFSNGGINVTIEDSMTSDELVTAVAAAILADPSHPIQTDESGNVIPAQVRDFEDDE